MAETKSGERPHDPKFPEKFLEFMRSGWGPLDLDAAPLPQSAFTARRREALSAAFPGELLIIPTGEEQRRSNDTYYPFRAGSDFVWLTGDQDPEGVLVLHPSGDGHEAVLYRRPRKGTDSDEFFRSAKYGELWIGRKHSLEETEVRLGLPCRDVEGLDEALRGAERSRTRLLRGFDARLDARFERGEAAEGGLTRDGELAAVLSELRLRKDSWELEQLQDAVDITVRGFEDVARVIPSTGSVSERLIEGVFRSRARLEGNGLGYDSIVGAGSHATTLHWITNDGATKTGELLLMDMGVENHHLYTADVTRTVPVDGRFTPLQRQVYDIVHASQQAGMDVIKPGTAFEDIHQTCMRVLAEGLKDLGILPGTVDEALDKDSLIYRRWTLHGFGHMLGLDVHDCAASRPEHYYKGAVQEDFVLTVEPGLYFQANDELVPEELRGVGIRIEDDVRVTADGCENLSDGLPRSSDEVETWLAEQREAGPRIAGAH
ncbi:aminopeptidase P family protein [Glycomyces terrestris]|uniref:Xaa-Pro aminopeptidase n=1 Tax=Glycomyces terrestris TaxID=2493553 RepID=A0A426V4L6_9ACTN|nr:aminopeptidase P family protein [Glycomyces terrestris]RRS01844.1 aminopeptidase P family protein [Glycomyces terrestris]